MVTTAEEKAEALASQYETVFTEEDKSNMPEKGPSPYTSMEDIAISTNGIIKLLKLLNPKKAIGPDLVSTYILKEHAETIAPILNTIFQQSLDTGVVPKDWLKANVTAIYKKGSKTTPANYRPVSLTCISCKVLEHIVFSSIMKHSDTNHIIKQYQHGFREKHSCETQLLTTVEEISRSLDKKHQTDLLILDFAKAFDTVAHQRLINKLDFYGIRGKTKDWIENWLTERHQTVVIDGKSSRAVRVKSGVPQGTVLGPLLFTLFINDIGDNVTSKIRLFADDCLLYNTVSSKADSDKLQEDLDKVVSWAETWQMRFNPIKCYHLQITRKKKPYCSKYTMMGVDLSKVESQTYLGVELTHDLSWNEHIKKTGARANKALNFVRRNLYDCPTDIKETAYKALVRPHLEYSSTVWDPHYLNDINTLEKVQRKAARFVLGKYRQRESPTEMMKDLKWNSLQERRLVARQTMLHKIISKTAAVQLPDYISKPRRITRGQHSRSFTNISASTDSYQFSFFPRSVRCWNLLPEALVTAPSADQFKASLWKEIDRDSVIVRTPRDRKTSLGSSSGRGPVTVC